MRFTEWYDWCNEDASNSVISNASSSNKINFKIEYMLLFFLPKLTSTQIDSLLKYFIYADLVWSIWWSF